MSIEEEKFERKKESFVTRLMFVNREKDVNRLNRNWTGVQILPTQIADHSFLIQNVRTTATYTHGFDLNRDNAWFVLANRLANL